MTNYENYILWKGWREDDFLILPRRLKIYYDGEFAQFVTRNTKILEIGFGNGYFFNWALSRGASVAGTELIPALAERARKLGVPVFEPDLSDALESHPGRFELIVAIDVLEHISTANLIKMFEAFSCLLGPEGKVIARFPNGQSPFGRAFQHGDFTHLSCLSGKYLAGLLLPYGWEIESNRSSFRPNEGVSTLAKLGWQSRIWLRVLIEYLVNRIYQVDCPMDPNVTVVLRKQQKRQSVIG